MNAWLSEGTFFGSSPVSLAVLRRLIVQGKNYEIKPPNIMIVLVIIAALVLGGGTAVIAEGAVPGEMLYSVKTSVNENVYAAAAVSDEAQARWQAKAAERRLEEAAELSDRGELSADIAAKLSAAFESHAEAALTGAAALAAEGNAEAATEVAAFIDTTLSLNSVLLKGASISSRGSSYTNASAENGSAQASSSTSIDADSSVEIRTDSALKADVSI